jgi:hypothetical protein
MDTGDAVQKDEDMVFPVYQQKIFIGFSQPTLIDACAGSGLVLHMIHRLAP